MRKILLLIIIVSTILLAGCSQSDVSSTERYFSEIKLSINTQDTEKMKKLFSGEIIKSIDNFDEQLVELFQFITGEIISYDAITSGGSSSKSWENKKVVEHIIRPRILNIETTDTIDNDFIYTIAFCFVVESKENNKKGLWFLEIRKYDGIIGENGTGDNYVSFEIGKAI